jgi:hypothetical protein
MLSRYSIQQNVFWAGAPRQDLQKRIKGGEGGGKARRAMAAAIDTATTKEKRRQLMKKLAD